MSNYNTRTKVVLHETGQQAVTEELARFKNRSGPYYIEAGRRQNDQAEVFHKTFSLKVLPRENLHMVVFAVVYDIT